MRIMISSGSGAGREYTISRQMTVGRSAACDIHLPDAGVSSRHASVRPIAGGIEVSDLGSTNGTFVNGVKLHSARAVYSGDRLRFARVDAAVAEAARTEIVVAPRHASNTPPAVPAGNDAGRKPRTAMLAGGLAAVVLVATAFGLGMRLNGNDSSTASGLGLGPSSPTMPTMPTSPSTSTPTPLPNPTEPPAPSPTRPPAPSPTQPPVPTPTQPPAPSGTGQALFQKLLAGTASLPGGKAQPEEFQMSDDQVKYGAVGFLGVELDNSRGGKDHAYWTVFPTPAMAASFFGDEPGTSVNSGDAQLQFKCGSFTNSAGSSVAFCLGWRTGSRVMVQGSSRPGTGTPDSAVASAYAKAGLAYLATIER